MDDTRSGRNVTDSKVGHLIEEYGLYGLGEELEDLWTRDNDSRYSLRALADYFNQQLLTAELERTDLGQIEGTIETIYRALQGDEIPKEETIRIRRQLERKDIDPAELQRKFVSYQAIRTYLRRYRGAEYDAVDSDTIRNTTEHIQKLRNRLRAVTETNLDRLASSSEIALDEHRITVNVRVLCEKCGSQYEVTELLQSGGCACILGDGNSHHTQ